MLTGTGAQAPGVYVTRVESNLKGGIAADLAPFTLIVGRNGARKTAIVASVELALTGVVSDVIGRASVGTTGANAWMIADMAPPDAGPVAAARLSSGVVSTCEAKRTDGGIGRAKAQNTFPDAFPLRTVREKLAGSPDTIRQWLLERATGDITQADILARLPGDDLRAAYGVAASAAIPGMAPVGVLLAIIEQSAKRAREAKKRGDEQDSYASTRAAELGPEPTAADLASAQAAVDAWAPLPDVGALRATMDSQIAAFDVAKAEYVKLSATITPADADLAAKIDALKPVADAARWHAGKGHTSCVVCGTAGIAPAAFAARAQGIDAVVAESTAQVAATVRVRAAHQQAQTASQRALDAVAAYEAAVAVVATRGAATSEDPRLRHQRIATLATGWASVRAAQARATQERDAAAGAEALHAACLRAVRSLVDSARDAFVARVQRFLPASDVFELRLKEGDRDVCRVGFLRNGQLHTALSGAEWARLCLALACATAKIDPSAPTVIVPEERAFDPHTLADTLRAIRDGATALGVPVQVLWTSPILPASPVDGWAVVDLRDAADRESPAQATPAPVTPAKRGRKPKSAVGGASEAAPVTVSAPVPIDDGDDTVGTVIILD
jgi:hypothetical protein